MLKKILLTVMLVLPVLILVAATITPTFLEKHTPTPLTATTHSQDATTAAISKTYTIPYPVDGKIGIRIAYTQEAAAATSTVNLLKGSYGGAYLGDLMLFDNAATTAALNVVRYIAPVESFRFMNADGNIVIEYDTTGATSTLSIEAFRFW